MNICFFSGDITRSGGTERVAILIAEELKKDKRYKVSFVSIVEEREKPFFEIGQDIERYTLLQKKVNGKMHVLKYIKALKKIVNANRIEILVDIDGIIDMYSIPVKWLTGVKIISWEHFNFYHHPSQKMRALIRKFAVNKVDAIVTLTEQDKEYYQKELKFHCPIYAIHNPKTYLIENAVYDSKSKTVISVGRLTEQKGFDRLVDVAEIVFQRHSDWEWLIFGSGEDQEIIQKSIEEKQLQKNVKLMGNVDDMANRYRQAAIFVMTSRFEGLPMTLLEAKCYKLPCISFDIQTGPRECIHEGVDGYLISDGNIKGMADKILLLMEDDKKRIRFSEHSQDNMDKFEMEHIIEQWKKLLGEI